MPTIENTRSAAVMHGDGVDVDRLLTDFALSLKERGWRVRGLVQSNSECGDGCARSMTLVDVDGNERYAISQNLGPGSVSCCIDAGGVAEACVVLRRALAEGADLVVANRFGGLEAAGGGFAAELLALMAEGVPLLTVVADKHLEAWRHFTGDTSVLLPPRREALEAWFAALHQDAALHSPARRDSA